MTSLSRADLGSRIARARDPRSLARRYHAQIAGEAPLAIPVDARLDPAASTPMLLEAKDHLDRTARDATLDPRTGGITREREGLSLDVHGTLDDLLAAMRAGEPEVRARVVRHSPERTADEIEGVRIDALLGTFETRYSTLEDAADRTFNLRVAAERIDGTVLMPGETFSLNALVGERTEANGFRPAPEIAGGELVDGVGGGTCQVAGTLHAAAFFAGLPIVERTPHSRPSAYLWMGMDATVVYPQLDLRFTNDLPFPVVIGFTVEGGIARAEIRGARQSRLVTFTRRLDEITPFRERDVQDPSLPLGVRVLRQRGMPGFRATRFRIVRDVDRNQAVRQHVEDTYPPTDQIWRVGTGAPPEPDYVTPEGDTHAEYTADEYLSATTGAGVPELEITRRAGRTALAGWTSAFIAPR